MKSLLDALAPYPFQFTLVVFGITLLAVLVVSAAAGLFVLAVGIVIAATEALYLSRG